MAGLKEYIEWRGDVPFSCDPFGEVDALVLAELSYLSLNKVLAGGLRTAEDGVKEDSVPLLPEKLTLREAAAGYDKDSVEEWRRMYSFDPDSELIKLAGESRRFGSVTIGGYCDLTDPAEERQFAAVYYDLPDRTRLIAYRGTDSTIAGWKEDFSFSYMAETPAQRLAEEYLVSHAGGSDTRLILAGHSKGGNLAVYAGFRCPEEIRSRIEKIYSFDAPGFRDDIAASEEYRRILPLIVSMIPESSLVGQLLTEGTEHIIVRSNAAGVMQHLAYSWQIVRNRFVRAEELSRFGAFINRTVSGWISGLSDEDRRMFVKALFDVIESSDAETFGELGKSKLKSSAALLKAMSSLRPEQQAALRHALKQLAKNGMDALT